MSLDGLRAWIGEVERKLGMRTRVFLVLTVIAIGAAGAAIYLALDARDSGVSESDVQALQQQLETQIGGGAAEGAAVAQLQAEIDALRTQLESQEAGGDGAGAKKGKGEGASGGDSGSDKGTGGEAPGGAESSVEPPVGGATAGGASAAKLKELLEQTKKQAEELE